ncbi:MAG: Holliday junction branch migration protein RuvA [Clostridiales bacterium]|nr:Holliday junction branch migration protein RuvA [Clostridiales bacterium]
MLSFLTGELVEKGNNIAVISCNGVGFEVNVSETTIFELPEVGQLAKLHTYMAVREDAITLFGFASLEEKSAFLKLINVSGIGGKMAIAILSAMPVANLVDAIVSENIKLLSSVKGLGKKTAERLVVELKNSLDDLQITMFATAKTGSTVSSACNEAIETLIAMGLSRMQATDIVKSVSEPNDKAEDIIKKSLKNMNK